MQRRIDEGRGVDVEQAFLHNVPRIFRREKRGCLPKSNCFAVSLSPILPPILSPFLERRGARICKEGEKRLLNIVET